MPKLKTNRAAAKRFRKTAKGFKRYASNRRHNLGHKDPKLKRQLARAARVSWMTAMSAAWSSCCPITK